MQKKGEERRCIGPSAGLVEIDSLFVLVCFGVPLLQEIWDCMGGLCGHNNTFAFEAKESITYRY